jgi:hypothetical protein
MNTIKIHRKISSSQLRIAELNEFIGKNVIITISETNTSEKTNKKAAGILSKFKNQEKIPMEKKAWEIAVNEKHGNN